MKYILLLVGVGLVSKAASMASVCPTTPSFFLYGLFGGVSLGSSVTLAVLHKVHG